MVVAIHPDHFLGNVRVILYVRAVCRHLELQAVTVDFRRKVEILHDPENLLIRHLDAKDSIHLLDGDGHLTRCDRVAGIDIQMGG